MVVKKVVMVVFIEEKPNMIDYLHEIWEDIIDKLDDINDWVEDWIDDMKN